MSRILLVKILMKAAQTLILAKSLVRKLASIDHVARPFNCCLSCSEAVFYVTAAGVNTV